MYVACLVVSEKCDKVVERVLNSLPELASHEAAGTAEEVLGQHSGAGGGGGNEVGPGVLVQVEQSSTLCHPTDQTRGRGKARKKGEEREEVMRKMYVGGEVRGRRE